MLSTIIRTLAWTLGISLLKYVASRIFANQFDKLIDAHLRDLSEQDAETPQSES